MEALPAAILVFEQAGREEKALFRGLIVPDKLRSEESWLQK